MMTPEPVPLASDPLAEIVTTDAPAEAATAVMVVAFSGSLTVMFAGIDCASVVVELLLEIDQYATPAPEMPPTRAPIARAATSTTGAGRLNEEPLAVDTAGAVGAAGAPMFTGAPSAAGAIGVVAAATGGAAGTGWPSGVYTGEGFPTGRGATGASTDEVPATKVESATGAGVVGAGVIGAAVVGAGVVGAEDVGAGDVGAGGTMPAGATASESGVCGALDAAGAGSTGAGVAGGASIGV